MTYGDEVYASWPSGRVHRELRQVWMVRSLPLLHDDAEDMPEVPHQGAFQDEVLDLKKCEPKLR